MAKRKRGDKSTVSSHLTNGHQHQAKAKAGVKSNNVEHHEPANSNHGKPNSDNHVTTTSSHLQADLAKSGNQGPPKVRKTEQHVDVKTEFPAIQIVAGSYERILHGITATMTLKDETLSAKYADSTLR